MCYEKPGPRCSGHAFKLLKVTRRNYREEPSIETFEKYSEAIEAFDATPEGFKNLEAVIDRGFDEQKEEASRRLELGRARRADALAAIKAKDAGDVNTEGSHLEGMEESENKPATSLAEAMAINAAKIDAAHAPERPVEYLQSKYRDDSKCHPSPGPRCSEHVREKLEKSATLYKAKPTKKNLKALQSLRDEYDSTDRGIAFLTRKANNVEEGERPALKARIAAGKARHRSSVEALIAQDKAQEAKQSKKDAKQSKKSKIA